MFAQTEIQHPKPTYCPEIIKNIDNDFISYSLVQVKPEFPNGLNNFYKYINSNLTLSDEIIKNKEDNGRVFISFIIEKEGVLSNVNIISNIDFNAKEKLKKVIQNSPVWLPAQHDGYNVRCKIMLPIKIDGTKQ